MILRHIAAGTLLLCLATSSFAQDAPRRPKWYVDFGAGEAALDHDEQGFTSLDDTSTSWSFRVGYKFSRFVALELGYIDIGDFSSMLLPSSCVSVTLGSGLPTRAVGSSPERAS